jgi:hypothetical protein
MAKDEDNSKEGVDYELVDGGQGFKTRRFFTRAEKEAKAAPPPAPVVKASVKKPTVYDATYYANKKFPKGSAGQPTATGSETPTSKTGITTEEITVSPLNEKGTPAGELKKMALAALDKATPMTSSPRPQKRPADLDGMTSSPRPQKRPDFDGMTSSPRPQKRPAGLDGSTPKTDYKPKVVGRPSLFVIKPNGVAFNIPPSGMPAAKPKPTAATNTPTAESVAKNKALVEAAKKRNAARDAKRALTPDGNSPIGKLIPEPIQFPQKRPDFEGEKRNKVRPEGKPAGMPQDEKLAKYAEGIKRGRAKLAVGNLGPQRSRQLEGYITLLEKESKRLRGLSKLKTGGVVKMKEGSTKDMREDKAMAKKSGMTMKQHEASAANKKHDAPKRMASGGVVKKAYGGMMEGMSEGMPPRGMMKDMRNDMRKGMPMGPGGGMPRPGGMPMGPGGIPMPPGGGMPPDPRMMKKGGVVKMKKGGMVRGAGCATRGKTGAKVY